MTKRIIISFVLVAFTAALFAVPTIASSIGSVSESSFRFSGDISHDRDFRFTGLPGRSRYMVEGLGEAQGQQDVVTKRAAGRAGLNIDSSFNVATDRRAGVDEHLRIANSLSLSTSGASLKAFTGVMPYPGQSGYVRTTSAAGAVYGNAGYLNYDNQFGTTGGVTVRELEIDDMGNSGAYLKESMRVEGYAEVWESFETRGSNAKTGWWDIGSQ